MARFIPTERIYQDAVTIASGAGPTLAEFFKTGSDELPSGKVPGQKRSRLIGASVLPVQAGVLTEAKQKDLQLLLEEGKLKIWINDILVVQGPVRAYPAGGLHGAGASGEAASEWVLSNGQGMRPFRSPVEVPPDAQFTVKVWGPTTALAANLVVRVALWLEVPQPSLVETKTAS